MLACRTVGSETEAARTLLPDPEASDWSDVCRVLNRVLSVPTSVARSSIFCLAAVICWIGKDAIAIARLSAFCRSGPKLLDPVKVLDGLMVLIEGPQKKQTGPFLVKIGPDLVSL